MRREGDARGDRCLDGNSLDGCRGGVIRFCFILINRHALLTRVKEPRRSERTSLSFLQVASFGGDSDSKGVS